MSTPAVRAGRGGAGMITSATVQNLAGQLDNAAVTRTACAQLSAGQNVTVDDAYAVQHAVVARRLGRGERVAGVKLGFTSRAKALQMGVSDVIIGQLTSGMAVAEGGEIDLDRFIHPRAEPEVAFRLAADIEPGTWRGNPAEAVDAVAPAMEIIDSRYRDFRFSLADVVADNTSAAGFVLGPWQAANFQLGNRGVLLEVDDRLVQAGSTAAILGDPVRAVPAAIRMAARYGITLAAGTVLLAGAATPAVAVQPGRAVTAAVSGLGRVRFAVAKSPERSGEQ
jgi:2-oxo-3-hexenedioate decarboxylase